jgi:hypothetical protein
MPGGALEGVPAMFNSLSDQAVRAAHDAARLLTG